MGRPKKSLRDSVNSKIDSIITLLKECHDEGSLEVIASEVLGYKVFDDDVDADNGASVIEECRMVLENITGPYEVDALYKRLVTHHK